MVWYLFSPACWELGFQAWAQSTCPELSAQGLVPLHWGCALPSPNAPGKAPNHIHTTLRGGDEKLVLQLMGPVWCFPWRWGTCCSSVPTPNRLPYHLPPPTKEVKANSFGHSFIFLFGKHSVSA